MKKLFLLFSFFLYMPSFAVCSINPDESICTLPDFKTNIKPMFQNTNAEANINGIQTPLQPFKEETVDKKRIPNNELMKYDSGCQFGVCVQDLKQNLPKN